MSPQALLPLDSVTKDQSADESESANSLPSISSLPLEIWKEIVGWTDVLPWESYERRRAQRSLCLVNKQFAALVQPMLWSVRLVFHARTRPADNGIASSRWTSHMRRQSAWNSSCDRSSFAMVATSRPSNSPTTPGCSKALTRHTRRSAIPSPPTSSPPFPHFVDSVFASHTYLRTYIRYLQ